MYRTGGRAGSGQHCVAAQAFDSEGTAGHVLDVMYTYML
jgi:hypothetical protein